MLFDDTDKVKGLHAKMLLSDVLQEREAQIAYRKRIEGLHRAREQEFLAQQKISLAVKLELFRWPGSGSGGSQVHKFQ